MSFVLDMLKLDGRREREEEERLQKLAEERSPKVQAYSAPLPTAEEMAAAMAKGVISIKGDQTLAEYHITVSLVRGEITKESLAVTRSMVLDSPFVDPFVVFTLADPLFGIHFEKRSAVIPNTLKPTWNQEFHFVVNSKPGFLNILCKDWEILGDIDLGRTVLVFDQDDDFIQDRETVRTLRVPLTMPRVQKGQPPTTPPPTTASDNNNPPQVTREKSGANPNSETKDKDKDKDGGGGDSNSSGSSSIPVVRHASVRPTIQLDGEPINTHDKDKDKDKDDEHKEKKVLTLQLPGEGGGGGGGEGPSSPSSSSPKSSPRLSQSAAASIRRASNLPGGHNAALDCGFLEMIITTTLVSKKAYPKWVYYPLRTGPPSAVIGELPREFTDKIDAIMWEADQKHGVVGADSTGRLFGADLPLDPEAYPKVFHKPSSGLYVREKYLNPPEVKPEVPFKATDSKRDITAREAFEQTFPKNDPRFKDFCIYLDRDQNRGLDPYEVKTGLFMLLQKAFAKNSDEFRKHPDIILVESLPHGLEVMDYRGFRLAFLQTLETFYKNLMRECESTEMPKNLKNLKRFTTRVEKTVSQAVELSQVEVLRSRRTCGILRDVLYWMCLGLTLPLLGFVWYFRQPDYTKNTPFSRGNMRIVKMVAFVMVTMPILTALYYYPAVIIALYYKMEDNTHIGFLEVWLPVVVCTLLNIMFVSKTIFKNLNFQRNLDLNFVSALVAIKQQTVQVTYFNHFLTDNTDFDSDSFLNSKQKPFSVVRSSLVALLLALPHSVIPGIYRVATNNDTRGDPAIGFFGHRDSKQDLLLTLSAMIYALPCLAILFVVLLKAVAEYSELSRVMHLVGALTSSVEAHQKKLLGYLDMRDSNNIEFWLLLRDKAKGMVDQSVKMLIGGALLADFVLLLALFIRLILAPSLFSMFNVLGLYDVVVISTLLVFFFLAVVKVNVIAKDVHLVSIERTKYQLAIEMAALMPQVNFQPMTGGKSSVRVNKDLGTISSHGDHMASPPMSPTSTSSKEEDDMSNPNFLAPTRPAGQTRFRSKRESRIVTDFSNEGIAIAKQRLAELQASSLVLESAVFQLRTLEDPTKIFGLVVDHAFVVKAVGVMATGVLSGILKFTGFS